MPSDSPWAASSSTATPRAWSPTRARLAPGVVPVPAGEVVDHWDVIGFAPPAARRRRPVGGSARGADGGSVLEPAAATVRCGACPSSPSRASRWSVCHSALLAAPRRLAALAPARSGPAPRADRPRRRRARRHGPGRGAAAAARRSCSTRSAHCRSPPSTATFRRSPDRRASGWQHWRSCTPRWSRSTPRWSQWCERHPVGPCGPALFPRCPRRQPTRVLRERRARTLLAGPVGDGGVFVHAVRARPADDRVP